MAIKGFNHGFNIRQVGTGYAADAKLRALVEDPLVRQNPGGENHDGYEKVYALLKRKDGTTERVELKYKGSEDPAPKLGVEDPAFDPTQGPHGNRGARLVEVDSGRRVDVYELDIDGDQYDLFASKRDGQFVLETNRGGHFEEAANIDNLFGKFAK